MDETIKLLTEIRDLIENLFVPKCPHCNQKGKYFCTKNNGISHTAFYECINNKCEMYKAIYPDIKNI